MDVVTFRSMHAVAAAALVIVAATACTPSPAPSTTSSTTVAVESAPATAGSVDVTTPSPAAAPVTKVTHYTPDHLKVLASFDNEKDSKELGTFDITTKTASVYVTCAGPGTITIKIDPVGTFPLACTQSGEPLPSENSFQVAGYGAKTFTVAIKSQPSQLWAATVAIDHKD